MRVFETGATRDVDETKLDFEAFFSPLVLRRVAEFMHKHRVQGDGSLRDGDNWQKGIPKSAYMKSGWRHFMEWWEHHRGVPHTPTRTSDNVEEALCALWFNVQGYLHELVKERIMGQEEQIQTPVAPLAPLLEEPVVYKKEPNPDPEPSSPVRRVSCPKCKEWGAQGSPHCCQDGSVDWLAASG